PNSVTSAYSPVSTAKQHSSAVAARIEAAPATTVVRILRRRLPRSSSSTACAISLPGCPSVSLAWPSLPFGPLSVRRAGGFYKCCANAAAGASRDVPDSSARVARLPLRRTMPVLAWIIVATWMGGVLSFSAAAHLALRARPAKVSLLVSYAIGTLLGAAFLEILPQAFELSASRERVSATLLIGILLFFLLEKLML